MSEQVTDEMVDVAQRLIYDDEPQWKRAGDGSGRREPKTFEECYGCAPHEHEEGKLMRLALEAALPLSPLSRRVEELEAEREQLNAALNRLADHLYPEIAEARARLKDGEPR